MNFDYVSREDKELGYWPKIIEAQMMQFVNSNEQSITFSSNLSSCARYFVYQIAESNCLHHSTKGSGPSKIISVFKDNKLRIKRYSVPIEDFYQQIENYDYSNSKVDILPFYHPIKEMKKSWSPFYKEHSDYINKAFENFYISNWLFEFIEITNPIIEPPNFKDLLISQEDYKVIKAKIESDKGIVLPSLIPTMFGPKSKFEKKTFQSPEVLKEYLEKIKLSNHKLKTSKLVIVGKRQLNRSFETILNKESGIITSLDFEAYEFDNSILLEVGIAKCTFTRKLDSELDLESNPEANNDCDAPTSSDSASPKKKSYLEGVSFGPFETEHYIFAENQEKKNSVYIKDTRESFSFGETQIIPSEDVISIIQKVVNESDLLIFHNDNAEISFLRKCNITPTKSVIIDTQKLAYLFEDRYTTMSLGTLMDLLKDDVDKNIPLHNAGNDAHFTLLAFFLIMKRFESIAVIQSSQSSDPTSPDSPTPKIEVRANLCQEFQCTALTQHQSNKCFLSLTTLQDNQLPASAAIKRNEVKRKEKKIPEQDQPSTTLVIENKPACIECGSVDPMSYDLLFNNYQLLSQNFNTLAEKVEFLTQKCLQLESLVNNNTTSTQMS